MATNIIERLFIEVGLDFTKMAADADKAIAKNDKLEKSLEGAEDASKKANKAFGEMSKGQKEVLKGAAELGKTIATVTKAATGFFSSILVSTGMNKLIQDVQKANNELYFLEKNLGLSARTIKSWQNVAQMSGGSAEGMTASMQGLNKTMNDFVVKGDTSMLPFFNALGVSMVDNNGKVRQLDDALLDISDSLSKMNRQQAYSLASDMGFDEGTINTLLQGRDAMKEMLDMQKTLYQSSEAELELSRELSKQQGFLNAQWESMKTMIGNILVPILLKLIKVVNDFFAYLQKHEKTIKNVFEGLAIVIGLILVPILLKATIALLAFIAPFAPFILVVGLLGAAFVALYDDYKKWAEGGRSLFDWTWFKQQIDSNILSVDGLKEAFRGLANDLINFVMPTIRDMLDVIEKIQNGDFKGAAQSAASALLRPTAALINHAQPLVSKVTWLLDKALGNDPNDPNSFTGQVTATPEIGTELHKKIVTGIGGKPRDDSDLKGKEWIGGEKPAFSNKNFTKEKAASIARVAKNIGVNPNDLAAVISFETGGTFSPSIKNPKSTATGLIQFMVGSGGTKGKYYGMSRSEFSGLSFDKQMEYVERYFKDRGFRADKKQDVASTYTAVTGYGYRRGSEAYELNKVWDSNRDGYIDKGEMVRNPSFRAHQRKYFSDGSSDNSALASGAARASEFLNQGNQLQQQSQPTVNNNQRYVDVKIGDINVQSSSGTIQGTVNDGLNAANSYSNQLISGTR